MPGYTPPNQSGSVWPSDNATAAEDPTQPMHSLHGTSFIDCRVQQMHKHNPNASATAGCGWVSLLTFLLPAALSAGVVKKQLDQRLPQLR
jgi:hypothetical protein